MIDASQPIEGHPTRGTRILKVTAIISFIVALIILLVGGYFAKDKVPPYPKDVTAAGQRISGKDRIFEGQGIYQRFGLMDFGSVWGHGTLRGMDFAALSLHLMGAEMRSYFAVQRFGRPYADLTPEEQEAVQAQTIRELKTNRYNPATGVLELPPAQAQAFTTIVRFWENIFVNGDPQNGILPNTIADQGQREALGNFFFWTAWAAGTLRPGQDYTYTSNWPHDPSVGNQPNAEAVIWSLLSIVSLLAVLGIVIYIVHAYRFFYGSAKGEKLAYQLMEMPLTPSQRSAMKFLVLAVLLFVLQIFNGGLLAHYTVHPGKFFIPYIGQLIPYNVSKSWHLQLGIFWIAVSWIGTAIFIAPVIGGKEPKGQRFLVNALFTAVVVVAVGSLIGEYLGIRGYLGKVWFWFGHQGWEFLELGRLWQILLFVGLIFWLIIVYRALVTRLTGAGKDHSGLTQIYTAAAILVVAFFGFGLFYGPNTHLTIADYWRWFVVHIWVESIFEFFGVAVIALFLVTLGLVDVTSAVRVAYLTIIITFFSGIVGTAHHYFWTGGPSYWLAIGGVFSSLEPIPLILLVVRAWVEYAHIKKAGMDFPYKWPFYFLTASSFWNFLGAGVFGFMINLPIINYYEHATYLTSNHGHTALFGVYGMLSVALLLFSSRSIIQPKYWNEKILKVSFWGLNGGLFLMFITVLLPVGLYQVYYVFQKGVWYARSADFYNLPLVQWLGTWRIVPDSIIILFGAFPLAWFLVTRFPRRR